MAGTVGKGAERPSSWVAAERRSVPVRDNGIGEALRIYYTRYLLIGIPFLLAVGAAGSYLLFDDGRSRWDLHLFVAVTLMIAGCWIGGWIYKAKRLKPRAELGWGEVLIALNKSDRKSMLRQIAGKDPVDPRRLNVARAVAVQLRESNATMLLYLPVAVAFLSPARRVWWYAIPMGTLLSVFIYTLIRDFRRQGRFLEKTSHSDSR
ncbi:MAG: hypothetical protein AVDCRST_MAG83-3813 [uncultured Arthrobacter sp.]|uniref:Uncharacterized protein n=1 Tax=uncultured Arthrobacter sp. TaxID=114050 RepID=A0A6J4JH49_9MICC|nr:hypothetical protein [uncultured Arthrobacter sp.]CAA9277325.1 MAG: hypothetical protein AVDCRST_MAG83-3813 [uncultured Arthrobacter sp.]